MANCPSCQNTIADDFGLVTCPHCGAQVMLEMDGAVGVEAPPPVPPDPYTPQLVDELSQVLVAEAFAESEPQPQMQTQSQLQEPLPRRRVAAEGSADLTELAKFGNSDVAPAHEGFLRFDIYIGGVDSADIREQIREVLQDKRFVWDADKILQDTQGGVLCIKQVTALKSSILIGRLRTLPVEIRWEQYAVQNI